MKESFRSHISLDQISIKVSTNSADLLSAVRTYFLNRPSSFSGDPVIEINIKWTRNFWSTHNNVKLKKKDNLGNMDFYVIHNPIVSLFKNFRVDNYKKYFLENVINTTILFPAMYYLERNRGICIIDSAAFTMGKFGIMIIGSAGIGKSTLSLSAIKFGENTRLISDDLVLLWRGGVSGFPAPIRLDEKSRSLARLGTDILEELPGVFSDRGRTSYNLNHDKKIYCLVNPKVIVLVQRGPDFSLKSISNESIFEKIDALTKENNTIKSYREFLEKFYGEKESVNSVKQTTSKLVSLIRNLDCYSLDIDQETDLGEVIKELSKVVE